MTHMIPKAISALLLALSLPLAASAQITENQLGDQPVLVPNTTYTWPVDDVACDKAYKARDAAKTILFCKLTVAEYNQFFITIGKDPSVDVATYRTMKWNQAYTESVELASAYDYTGDRQDALLFAADALRIAKSLGPSDADQLADNASQLADAIMQHYPELQK